MCYRLEISESLDQKFSKLSKKDKLQFEILSKKIKAIIIDPYQFKSLRGNIAGQRRVHIRHFVLTYEIQGNEKIIRLLDYDHHDSIYR